MSTLSLNMAESQELNTNTQKPPVIYSKISRQDLFAGGFLLVIFIIYLAIIQFSTNALAGTDGYYHVKIARIMAAEGLVPDFRWLPLTILNEAEFYDHHFLYHVALIPFTLLGLMQGAKWASVLFASLAFLSFWWVLQRQKIPYSTLWALGLLVVSEAFLYRMSMVRAQSLSLLVMLLGLHWMFTGRYRRLIPLGFLYVWLYDAFPLLVALAVIYVAAKYLTEGELIYQPILYSGMGIALGLLINPYFPDNITFIYRHLIPKLTDATSVRVGNEWFPYRTDTILQNSLLALGALVAGALALGLSKRRMKAVTATSFLASVLFAFMLFQSRRFIEYFPPFALMFAAFAWEDIPIDKPSFNLKRNPLNGLKPGLLVAFLLVGTKITLPAAQDSLRDSGPVDRYAAAAGWLAENTPQGSMVFQTDWDDFTRLFYYNTHNTYLVGLDPTYLQLYDRLLYDLWVEITIGDIKNPSKDIREVFEAQYVFSDLNHTDFIRQAEQDDGLEEVYRDKDAVIYRVIY
jgi:hypothetical protein